MVTAKFRVHHTQEHAWGTEVEMHPVYAGSKENEDFFAATPSGTIKVTIKNTVAASQLQKGKEYYVTFTEAAGA